MKVRNGSNYFNHTGGENQKDSEANINDDEIFLSSMDKVVAFSIVYGVLFIVSVGGKKTEQVILKGLRWVVDMMTKFFFS